MSERDLFANFARMRREMDEVLGDVWGQQGYGQRRGRGFSPPVDVYYTADPQRAMVRVDVAGVEMGTIGTEAPGRPGARPARACTTGPTGGGRWSASMSPAWRWTRSGSRSPAARW